MNDLRGIKPIFEQVLDGDGKGNIEGLKVFMTCYEKENPPVKPQRP